MENSIENGEILKCKSATTKVNNRKEETEFEKSLPKNEENVKFLKKQNEDDNDPNEINLQINCIKRDLSGKEIAMIGLIAIANLCSTTVFSCIAPFYPIVAKNNELSIIQIGIIFGAFDLVMIFSSPLFGKYMHKMGSRKVFTFGQLFAGINSILFGFLILLPKGHTFFFASLLIRCTQAIGDTAITTSSLVISAKSFPRRISFIVGIRETFVGLGYTIGPVFGGLLYEIGGFKLPFFVLGCLLIFSTFSTIFLVKAFNEGKMEEKINNSKRGGGGIKDIFKIPVIWIMIFAVILCGTSFTFVDPTLSDHLYEFNLSTTIIGLLFLLSGGLYSVTAPIWGLFIDRWHCCNGLLIFGALLTVISMVLIGPSPIINCHKNLYLIGISLSLLGIGSGAIYIPTFQNCLNAVKKNGYDDSSQTYGAVSGIFQSAFALGSFIGPTIAGGYGVQYIGFEWSATAIAFTNLLFVLISMFGRFAKKL